MANETYTFKKEERLCSKKLLAELFKNGSSFLFYPFRVTWQLSSDSQQTFPAQVVISVSKRNFKRSVDRNLIKRRIKEAYRLNKYEFFYKSLDKSNAKLLLALNYVGKEIHDSPFIEKKMKLTLTACLNHVVKC